MEANYFTISWLQSPSAVILEPRNIKSDTVSTVSPSISHEVMGPDAMIFVYPAQQQAFYSPPLPSKGSVNLREIIPKQNTVYKELWVTLHLGGV